MQRSALATTPEDMHVKLYSAILYCEALSYTIFYTKYTYIHTYMHANLLYNYMLSDAELKRLGFSCDGRVGGLDVGASSGDINPVLADPRIQDHTKTMETIVQRTVQVPEVMFNVDPSDIGCHVGNQVKRALFASYNISQAFRS